jgi:hypothetical protein
MQIDAQPLITKACFRGQSHRKLDGRNKHGVEVRSVIRQGAGSRCVEPWFSLPGQTGLAPWSGSSLFPAIGTIGAAMSDHLSRHIPMPGFAMGRLHLLDTPDEDSGIPMARRGMGRDMNRNTGVAPCFANCFLCASLWLSLALAIWMSRGWIGLLFSGQILSAVACVIQKLAQRTQCVIAACGATEGRWDGRRNVP